MSPLSCAPRAALSDISKKLVKLYLGTDLSIDHLCAEGRPSFLKLALCFMLLAQICQIWRENIFSAMYPHTQKYSRKSFHDEAGLVGYWRAERSEEDHWAAI